MTRYALRIASILIIIHSLLFFPAPVSRAQEHLTETEVKQAQAAASLFLKLLEETGDFSRVIGLNKSADDFLNGGEADDEIFENLIPPNLITLFNNHPVLKNFIDIEKDDKPESIEPVEEAQGDSDKKKRAPKPIDTPEEMRSVIETLQKGLRMLLEEQGAHSPRLIDNAKKAIEMIRQKEPIESTIRISDKEYFGFPAGVRFLEVPTPPMFMLTLAEVNGKQRIVWAELFVCH